MAKCPLCGSSGDDLVFRFYCANAECANYVPPKEEGNPDGGILAKGEVFRFGKPEFIGRFPVRNAPFSPAELEILEGSGVPKEFFDNDDRPYPLFDLVMDRAACQMTLKWIDRVPEVLAVFLEPILESRIGEQMTENARLSIRDEIVRDLLRMCARNELVWNRYRGRWELHFTE